MNPGFDCDYLSAEDIELLRGLYDQICRESGIQPGTPTADEVAHDMVIMFKDGIREAAALRRAIAKKAA